MTKRIIRTYSELITIPTFEERFQYLKLNGIVGDFTFGGHRQLNQMLYKMPEWKKVRREVILRDEGFDLAHEDFPILGNIYVHHMNPITIDDILERRSCVLDPENLISASLFTHNAIHYGTDEDIKCFIITERKRNDTCPWR